MNLIQLDPIHQLSFNLILLISTDRGSNLLTTHVLLLGLIIVYVTMVDCLCFILISRI